MHLGMVSLMNASIALEDPFTTDGVDGVYCEEALFEVEQARASLTPGFCTLSCEVVASRCPDCAGHHCRSTAKWEWERQAPVGCAASLEFDGGSGPARAARARRGRPQTAPT